MSKERPPVPAEDELTEEEIEGIKQQVKEDLR